MLTGKMTLLPYYRLSDRWICKVSQSPTDQNSPSSPIESKIVWILFPDLGCQSIWSLSGYHSLDNDQQVSTETVIPLGIFSLLQYLSTCFSDRKNWIVDHVKPTSSQNFRGGTEKWMTPSELVSFPSWTPNMTGTSQSGQVVSVSESISRIAGMPSASQAQLA